MSAILTESDYSRVVTYVNIRISSLYFSLCKDIINHRDILLILFFNNNNIFWLMNIYSDSSYTALKYLKDTEVCVWNLLIMTGDFNIYNSLWDPSFSHHSSISDNLLIITVSFNLKLSNPTNQVLTKLEKRWYSGRASCPCILCYKTSVWIDFRVRVSGQK